MPPARWRIRLSQLAENDFATILAWTRERFGDHQFDVYKVTLVAALARLELGPDVAGSRGRDEILPGLRSLHIARAGRRGRHFILYRSGQDHWIEVIRILHDAMDIDRHIEQEDD